MPEQPPSFVVVDKRKFTLDGEIREGITRDAEEAAPSRSETRAIDTPDVDTPNADTPDNVITMPPRGEAAANDLAEESMSGTLYPLDAVTPTPEADGDGPQTDADLPDDIFSDAESPFADGHTAEEAAAQESAYRKSTSDLDALLHQADPSRKMPGAVSFAHLVQSFYLSAVMAMGAGTEPGQQPRVDILGARQAIDLLSVLEEKTRGNLTQEETQLLQSVTFELRMAFLELTNAISRQAHQGPPAGSR